MRTKKIGGHVVEFYDSIDVMITARLMQFHKYTVLEGIAPNAENLDRMDKEIIHWAKKKQFAKIDVVTKNRNQSLHFALSNINPGTLSHACWVSSIDGKKYLQIDGNSISLLDHSDEGLQAVARLIEKWDTRQGMFYQMADQLKKKLIASLRWLFLKYLQRKRRKVLYSVR